MSYLARLKQLDNGKKSLHTPDNEPTKPTKPPFDGFVGSGQGHIEKIFIKNEPVNDADQLLCVVAKLTQLVRQCGDAYGFTEAEHADALEAALVDSESALTCFRSIAAELANNDADPTPQVIAIPHPGTADRRLTIASSAGQYQGAECGNCLHLTMTQDLPTPARRRQFQWACKAGFKPLATGYGSERVLVAPDDCGSYLTMEQTGACNDRRTDRRQAVRQPSTAGGAKR